MNNNSRFLFSSLYERIGVRVTENIDSAKYACRYDGYGRLPSDMREKKSLSALSVSGVKWSFVKVFPDTQTCIDHLTNKKFVSMVTSPHIKGENNVVLHDGDYTQKRLAVWFGNESRGISDLAVKNAEACINIEIFGMIESLNLATCSGIVLYEITKQRRAYQNKHKRGRKIPPQITPMTT